MATEIQEERMRRYFIDAAIEIIRGEGLKAVNARNIAARAGFSYATLYNYFKDINTLLFECISDFQSEIREQVKNACADSEKSDLKALLRKSLTAWTNYYVQYPGIFELFYIERMGDFGNRKETAQLISNSIPKACEEAFERMKKELPQERFRTVSEEICFSMTGLMLHYTNRLTPPDYPTLLETLNRLLDSVLTY